MVVKFLFGLHPNLQQIHNNVLSSDNIPTLSNALSRILRVTIDRVDSIPVDNSTMSVPDRGRGLSDRHCDHCIYSNHDSDKYWEKFDKPNCVKMAHIASSSSLTPDMITPFSPVMGTGVVKPTTHITIGWGYERDDLYYLDGGTPAPSHGLFATVSPNQWHGRLGHPSSVSPHSLVPIESVDFHCESCELGKHHLTYFSFQVDKRSSSAFELVHCDV